jgi:hypothetical protein
VTDGFGQVCGGDWFLLSSWKLGIAGGLELCCYTAAAVGVLSLVRRSHREPFTFFKNHH